MSPTLHRMFECGECGDLHEHDYDAEECCMPVVSEVNAWACAECGFITKDEEAARYCCLAEDITLPATPRQLEAAGQQRLSL